MIPTKPRDDERPADYEQLRRHLGRPPLEHPAVGGARSAPPVVVAPTAAATSGSSSGPASHPSSHRFGLSVMDWLLAIGHVVARRLRRVPRSPMVPLHPRK
jgi:hypothetical protein